jgi:hypothetical protein|tara:strand:- start:334 stop:588 length:255 start_codon:yes stop_codon:yes gene_type:complete
MGDSLYNNFHTAKYFVGVDMNKTYMIAFFFIGIAWGWGLIAIIGVTLEVRKDVYAIHTSTQEMPEIINTIQTIPVVVYELERTE